MTDGRTGMTMVAVDASQVAALLRDKGGLLLDRWVHRVLEDPRVPRASHLTRPVLLDHVPALIERLARGLERAEQPSERPSLIGQSVGRSATSHAHAAERFEAGFTLSAVLSELAHLRMAFLDLCDDEGVAPAVEAARLVHAGLDEMMATAAVDMARLDRRALEEQSAIAKTEHERAEQASRAKDAFLTTLSHELRTPLNAVLGWTRILQTRAAAQPELADAIDAVERNAVAQARLVEDLLDASRITSGKLSLVFEPTELASVVSAAVEAIAPIAEAKQVKLQFDGGPSARVLGDSGRLVQVFWNLLANAVKFSAPGGHVVARIEPAAVVVRTYVVDHGEGIAASFFPRLYERFQQEDDSLTRPRGGLGLGLALVRELVELHGGTVHAQSEGKGAGATFVVELPVLAVPA